jgi:Rod binding domain-containing protein
MASVAPTLAPAAIAQAQAQASAADQAKRTRIAETAQSFEASFLSVMIGQMFEGVNTADSAFGGGEGEQAFKSFMAEAMAKQVVRSGGIGLSTRVQQEMLKLQGLEPK